jgi:hypothetical protein
MKNKKKKTAVFLIFISFIAMVYFYQINNNKDKKEWKKIETCERREEYEKFIKKYPKSTYSDSAKFRLSHIDLEQAWQTAINDSSIPGYKDFLIRHPDSKYDSIAKINLNRILLAESWDETRKVNSIKGYKAFIALYPKSKYVSIARKKIIELEVQDIEKSNPGQLPVNSALQSHDRSYSIYNIFNNTDFDLTIRYVGVDTFKVIFIPHEKGSIEILNGTYSITASVEAPNVRNYFGKMSYKGGDHQGEFYIRSGNSIRLPQLISSFSQWEPIKRKIDYNR